MSKEKQAFEENYSARIINIQCQDNYTISAKEGHREARHKAAEIAIEAENQIEQLKAENERKNEIIKNMSTVLRDNNIAFGFECLQNVKQGVRNE